MNFKTVCYLICGSFFLFGCNLTEESVPRPAADRITLAVRTLNIPATVAADSTLTISFSANKDWSLTAPNQDWLQFSDTSGRYGKGTLGIKVLSINTGAQKRTLEVTFSAGSASAALTISQDPFVFSAVPNTVALGSAADSRDTFLLLTTGDWALEAVYPPADPPVTPWISFSPVSGTGQGITAVEVTATSENATDADRTMQLKATQGGQDPVLVTVVQKYKTALTLSLDHIEAACEGDTIEISVTSNADYTAQVVQGGAWIHPVSTKAMTTLVETYEIDPAVEDGPRTGMIVFTAGSLADTVTVYQAQLDRLVLSSRNLSVPNEGGFFDVTLRTNVEYEVAVPDSVATWVQRVTASTKAMRTDMVTLQIAANALLKDRRAVVIFSNKNNLSQTDTLTIIQLQNNQLLLSATKVSLYDQTDSTLVLETNVPYTVEIPRAAGWVSLLSDTGNGATRLLKFGFSPNAALTPRSATVTVKHTQSSLKQEVTFTQAAYAQQPFVTKTVFGYYQEATPVYVYSPGEDQWAFVSRATSTDFRIQNVADVKLISLEGFPLALQEGASVSVRLTSRGLTQTPQTQATLRVLRKKDHTAWLMNATTNEGYIIYQ